MMASSPQTRKTTHRMFVVLGVVIKIALLLLPLLFVPAGILGVDWIWNSDGRTLSVATYAAIFAIVAYGLAMLMRFVGLPSVVHGAFWGIGAYTASILADSWGWGFWATLPLAALLPAAIAVLVGFPSLRTHGLTFIIVTLALCEFLVLVGTNWTGLTNGPVGMMLFQAPDALGPLTFNTSLRLYYLVLAFLYVVILLVWLIARSAFGRRLLSIRDNELLARSLGLNTLIYKMAIFVITAMVVGVGGQLYLYHQQAIQPNLFGAIPFIDVLLMVVMGGTNVLVGPAVGAWMVQFLPEWLEHAGITDPNAHRLAFGTLLVAFMLLAPQGIAGAVKAGYRRLRSRVTGDTRPRAPTSPGESSGSESAPLKVASGEAADVADVARAHREIGEVILEVRELSRRFGALWAVKDVSFSLRQGEVLGVIGPNGSGKTTLFNGVSGLLRPSSGSVWLRGENLSHRPLDEVARRGLIRTFQHPMLFPSQTVRESIRMALDISTAMGQREMANAGFPRETDALLAFCGLTDMAGVPVQSLAYGHTRLLGVAIALAVSPHVLMLDEPAAGLNHVESQRLAALLLRVRDAGTSLVVVDHDMSFLLPLCDRMLVLDAGNCICQGSPEEVRNDPRVIEVYLGKSAGSADLAVPVHASTSPCREERPPDLVIRDLAVAYGSVPVLHGISLTVGSGEAVALLGANGAGKSTTLRAVTGLLRPGAGQILWGKERLVGRPPSEILGVGIAHVPEGRQVFARQSVQENLLLGQFGRRGGTGAQARRDMDYLLDVFPALKPKLKQPAGDLSGGQQQMLAIARGLMSNPSLLILDEPSLGLSPVLVDEVAELVARLRAERGMSLLLVEQNPLMAARLTERVYILENGRIRGELASKEVMGNVDLLDAYLGSAHPASR